jgi:hypothetical protein
MGHWATVHVAMFTGTMDTWTLDICTWNTWTQDTSTLDTWTFGLGKLGCWTLDTRILNS